MPLEAFEAMVYIAIFSLKPFLDFYALYLFGVTFLYLYKKKREALTSLNKKFTSFNKVMLGSIGLLVFMRAFGSLYTFFIGVTTVTDDLDHWLVSYEIFDDIVFPLRDFIEALFFA